MACLSARMRTTSLFIDFSIAEYMMQAKPAAVLKILIRGSDLVRRLERGGITPQSSEDERFRKFKPARHRKPLAKTVQTRNRVLPHGRTYVEFVHNTDAHGRTERNLTLRLKKGTV